MSLDRSLPPAPEVPGRRAAWARRWSLTVCTLAGFVAARPAGAQVTQEDYRRAERFLGWNLQRLVAGHEVRPQWLPDGRFWYRNRLPAAQREFVVVDPARGDRRRAFDHARLASALTRTSGVTHKALELPFQRFTLTSGGDAIEFTVGDTARWTCDLGTYDCGPPLPVPARSAPEGRSPDGRWDAFVRDHNLWVRSVATGEEIRLSDDGAPDYGYAVHSEGWTRSGRAVLLWSPDSKKIATYRLDERRVGRFHILETTVGRPVLHSYPYAIPGDSTLPMMERYVFDVASGQKVRIQVAPDYLRATNCCGMLRGGRWTDVQWSGDGRRVYFVSVSRDYRNVTLVSGDAETGTARVILRDRSPTYFESNLRYMGRHNWRVLDSSEEVIWFSERDGWAHLYLYDGHTGALERRLTEGSWTVGDVEQVDEVERTIVFTARGKEPGRNPYFAHLYRGSLDDGTISLLTPEDANHEISVSPAGTYFVDTYSRPDTIPITVVRNRRGQLVTTVERADVSKLLATGWKWPAPFTVKARDGVTDLHGLLFWPSWVEPDRRYPLIVYIYPGPQIGSVRSRSFTANPRGHPHALAELGFVVMQLDAMGTPLRSKAFHDAWFGDMGDNGLADQVAAVKQLARRHPQIDLSRVGIYGSSGGGFAAAGAILRFPEFFRVAVSAAGNHDNRGYIDYWGEKYQGLLRRPEGDVDNYENQASAPLAANLRGKLLLMYGSRDDNVHPNLTLLLIEQLIEHNKDFNLLVLPNRRHGFSNEPYVVRRTWDYFVRHLLRVQPPPTYRIAPPDP